MRSRQPSSSTLSVLTHLSESDEGLHGYAIMQATGLASGTLYPILKRLTKRGWLKREWEVASDESGPPRRLYRLTPQGRTQAKAALEQSLPVKPSSTGVVT